MSRMSPHYLPPLGVLLAVGVMISCSEPPTVPSVVEPSAARAVPAQSNLPVSPGWQAEARALVALNKLSPFAAARVYAVLNVAQYRAVVAADGHFDVEGTHPEHGLGTGGRRLIEGRRGAVAGASLQVLTFFFPAAAQSLESRMLAEAAAGAGNVHPFYTRGFEIGRDVGDALVARTRADGFATPWTGTVPTGVGIWRATPAGSAPVGAVLVNTTPWLLESASQFRSPPPPAFGSSAFVAATSEIFTLASQRTPAQTKIANDWNLPGGTYTPAGYWNDKAATYVQAYSLDERRATHVFALMHAAMFDSQVACWDTKMYYWVPRPSQADPTIVPYLAFPVPNHPSYPSGHSCLSAAAGEVLTYFFPDRATELDALVAEAGLSRMLAGIHFGFDVAAGQTLGAAVADWSIAADEGDGLLAATL
ncbi:MAG TPA: phosphatase PAP2 family protein [Gemmatimonadaceae bacterium]|nr:phosphatase PAP2 family protein [Gemmatimonadaceae bacterium]